MGFSLIPRLSPYCKRWKAGRGLGTRLYGLIIAQDALTGEDSTGPASHHPNSTVSGGISGVGREIGGGRGGRGGGRGRGENGRREREGRGDEGGRGGEGTRVIQIQKGKCLGK